MTKRPKRQAPASEGRLALIDEILRTAGWAGSDNCWSPPPSYAALIAEVFGDGTLSRAHAIASMVNADSALVSHAARAAA